MSATKLLLYLAVGYVALQVVRRKPTPAPYHMPAPSRRNATLH